MSDRLLKESDVLRIAFQLPLVVNSAFADAVKALPSADRPQGEWIDAEIPLESGGSMPIQACNLCKTFYPLAYTGGGHRFCPNCGAKMKGGK